MASVTPTTSTPGGRTTAAQWILTNADSDGLPWPAPGAPDKTVQVSGTFDSGTVVIQGSNDPSAAVWSTMHAPDGAELSFTAAGIEAILENPLWIRPVVTGEGATASITIAILAGVKS